MLSRLPELAAFPDAEDSSESADIFELDSAEAHLTSKVECPASAALCCVTVPRGLDTAQMQRHRQDGSAQQVGTHEKLDAEQVPRVHAILVRKVTACDRAGELVIKGPSQLQTR